MRQYINTIKYVNWSIFQVKEIVKSYKKSRPKDIKSRNREVNKRIKNEKSNNKKEIHKNNGGIQYGNQKTYGSGNNEYPNLYAKENGSGINTETVKTDGIDINAEGDNSPTTEDASTANDGLTVTQTYYYMSSPSAYFDNQEFYNMIFGTDLYYWLASRCANCDSPFARFGLSCVGKSNLDANGMFDSNGNTINNRCRFRPVVSLGADIQITPVENADGSTPSNMHQISKKWTISTSQVNNNKKVKKILDLKEKMYSKK